MKTIQILLLGLLTVIAVPTLQAQTDETVTDHKTLDAIPIYPSCETKKDKEAKKKCSERGLLKYAYQNVRYPTIARENNIQGLVVVSFVVNKEGKIEDVNIIRDIGGGCGAETVRVIESMNLNNIVWTPGKLDGKAVKVKYFFPIRFKLEESSKEVKKEKKRKWWQRKKN